MKYTLVTICLFLSACATSEQKLEKDYLKSIHMAERKIALGKAGVALGNVIVTRGLENIEEGEINKAIAAKQLMESVGIINEDSPPETP